MTSNGFYHKKARKPSRFFTLIEILAAMAVLSILMLMLFMFFGSAQRAWSQTEATAEVFENGRIIFDILQRDLQSVVARQNDVPGNNIAFSLASTSSNASLNFVSVGADNGELNEIGYQWATTTTDAYTLSRAMLTVTTASGSGNPYAARSGRPAVTYQPVAEGVINLVVLPTTCATLPNAVIVQVTLLDKKSFALWSQLTDTPTSQALVATRKGRSFSKIISIGNRQ